MSTLALPSPSPRLSPPVRPRRTLPLATVVLLHLAVIWVLIQNDTLRNLAHDVRPLMVALISDVAAPAPMPSAPALRPPPLPQAPPVPLAPWPAITVSPLPPKPEAVAAPTLIVPAAPPASAPPVALAAAPVAAAASAAPRTLAASAIRYRVPPAVEVPLASRRLGESGTVMLRVLVDSLGMPSQVSVHRSSGHRRLDEQAVSAMRQARFQPQTENGAAVEWLVYAPLLYELD